LVARRLSLPVSEPAAILEMPASAHVILVDTVVTGSAPGTIHTWEASARPLTHAPFRGSTHSLGVADTIELTSALGRLPKRVTIYGIEGVRFEPGAAPLPAVAVAVDQLVRILSVQCNDSE
jgi:hydrogenase maturation protease